jgi:hypothetical protein
LTLTPPPNRGDEAGYMIIIQARRNSNGVWRLSHLVRANEDASRDRKAECLDGFQLITRWQIPPLWLFDELFDWFATRADRVSVKCKVRYALCQGAHSINE